MFHKVLYYFLGFLKTNLPKIYVEAVYMIYEWIVRYECNGMFAAIEEIYKKSCVEKIYFFAEMNRSCFSIKQNKSYFQISINISSICTISHGTGLNW